MSKKALLIGLSWEQQPLIDRMLKMGWNLHGIHQQGSYGVSRANELNGSFQTVELCDLRDLKAISEISNRIQPALVISDQCDYSHFAQAFVANRLGLPGPSIDAAQISSNKYLQRERCKSKNIDIPEYRLCTTLTEAMDAAREIGFPIIVKPTDNRGSFGVNRVNQESELGHAFFEALENSHSRTILVEEFIEGIHITVDGYAFPELGCKSLALATKGLIPNTSNQVAIDIVYPGELEPSLQTKAFKVNESVNQQIGYSFGMTHSEYMVTKTGRIVLIESANRGGGCFTSQLIVPAVSGIDLIEQLLSDVQGEQVCTYETPQNNSTILKFFSLAEGVIKKISGMQNLTSHPNVLAARMMVEEGQLIQPVRNDANRHGFVIYSNPASSPAVIRGETEQLLEKIQIEYMAENKESLVA